MPRGAVKYGVPLMTNISPALSKRVDREVKRRKAEGTENASRGGLAREALEDYVSWCEDERKKELV